MKSFFDWTYWLSLPERYFFYDDATYAIGHRNVCATKRYHIFQKQSSRGFLRKEYSENMHQIYRRTPMPKCDFNKVACNFIEIALRHGCSPVNLLHIFRTPFYKNSYEGLLLILVWQLLCRWYGFSWNKTNVKKGHFYFLVCIYQTQQSLKKR